MGTQRRGGRRLLAVASALALAVSLAACGGSDSDGGDDRPLRIWVRQAADGGLPTYQAMADLYGQQTGQKIELYGEVTGFEQSLIRAAAARNLPDAIIQDTESLGQLVTWGMVQEVDPNRLANRADILDVAWTAARAVDGKYYAVPTSTQAFNLYIRKDWRDALGLENPTTWDDVVDLAKAFTFDDPDGNGADDTWGYLIPGSTTRGYASWFWITLLWQAGGDYFEPQGDGTLKPALDSPAAKQAMQWLYDMVHVHKVVQPGASTHVTADAHPYFRSGQVGLYHTGPYMISTFDNEPGRDVYEVIKPVRGPASNATLAEGEQLYIMTGTNKYDEVLKFAEWIASPAGQVAGMNPGGYAVVRLPINKNVDPGQIYGHPYWNVVAQTYAESGRYVTPVPNFSPFRQMVADAVNVVLADPSVDIDAVLAELNAKVGAELAAQGVLASS
jgi:multiple sugar transport system substrate-binding protein